MSDNFYSPPKTNVVGKPPEHRGSPVWAIGICALLDIGATFIMSAFFAVLYGNYLYSQGMSESEIDSLFKTIDYTHPMMLLVVVIGLLISMAAGYLCAKMINYHEYAHGLILGITVVFCGWGLDWIGDSTSDYSVLETIMFSVINIAVVIIGAHGYVKNKTKPLN